MRENEAKKLITRFHLQKSNKAHLNHYKDQTKNDPSSLALFEKKLRSIAYSIKDEFIKKYVLEYFLEKISLLTPNSNQNINKNFYKKAKSLKSTQKYFNETKFVLRFKSD